MLTRWGGKLRTLREWSSAGEWMPDLLRIQRPPTQGFQPGLVIVELTGCDRRTWDWARERGAFPFASALCARENYGVHDYYAGCPWSRAGREAELLQGATGAFPGDVYWSKYDNRLADLTDRDVARSLPAPGDEALLVGGSAWGTLLPGGAAAEEFHGTQPALGRGWAAKLRNRLGTGLDIRRGLPAIYLRQSGVLAADTDEYAVLAHWRRQDRRLQHLYERVRLSRRRDYELWILLTPGVQPSHTFADDEASRVQTALGSAWRVNDETATAGRDLRLLAHGPLAHLYARDAVSDADKADVAARLAQASHVAAVLWRDSSGHLHGAEQLKTTPDAAPTATVRALGEWLPHLTEADAQALASHPNAGDWVIFCGEKGRAPCEQAEAGVALLPARTRTGRMADEWLRARDLYRAGRHVLNREPLPYVPAPQLADTLRLVTYNVHRCIGMDARQSVRRVQRVLADLDADFIALQEVAAFGRNQAEELARELGMQAVFCPTLTGNDAYGHGLLLRHPFTVKKVALLPLTRAASWKEPRGAIHVEVHAGTHTLNLFTTHLALGQADRSLQVDTLLGPDWIGGVADGAPVALCGDFNFVPGGRNYRLITRSLRDAQLLPGLGAPLRTFSTIYPVARLDHVFLSPQFEVSRIHVPRTDLTRVASDHFPLIADLRLPAAST